MKPTVLIIDDDPIDLGPLQMLLESWDLDVLTATSGEAGLSLLAQRGADLLVSDVYMPGLKGEDVMKRARNLVPGLPVVLITGKSDVKSAVSAMRLGAFDYVSKPPDPDDLRLTIERAIEHGRLHRENKFLRAELRVGGMYGERLLGRSEAMTRVFDVIRKAAPTESTVLITGETGTGKASIAQTIHYNSSRADQPLVAFNFGSLNPSEAEHELFGAGGEVAVARRGRFEEADGGTLLLIGVDETHSETQPKLQRAIREKQFPRVGSHRDINVNVRLIASTTLDLEREVREGRFLEDLLYDLSVIPIHLPALRDRREDIPLLADHFLQRYSREYHSPVQGISDAGHRYLETRPWNGNVRELQHTIERAVVLAEHDVIEATDLHPPSCGGADSGEMTLQSILDRKSREHLIEVLDRTGWQKQKTADILGIDRVTLYRLLKKLRIDKK